MNKRDMQEQTRILMDWLDVRYAIEFAAQHDGDPDMNVSGMQDMIAVHATASDAIDFAQKVSGADWGITQNIILERGNGQDAMRFLELIPTLKGDPRHKTNTWSKLKEMPAYRMAKFLFNERYIANDDVRDTLFSITDSIPRMHDLQNIVVNGNDAEAAYLFAKYIPDADTNALEDVLTRTKNAGYAALFASEIDDADIEKLQDIVLQYGSGDDARFFAQHLISKGADLSALQNVVIERGDGGDAFVFAKYVQGADIDALQGVILDRGTPVSVLRFATEIETSDAQKLHNKMLSLCIDNGAYLEMLSEFETNPNVMRKAEEKGGLQSPARAKPR